MNQLASMRAFVAVAQLKSFTKAADLLDISTPAISRLVADLEAHTELRLLNRTTRSVTLAEDARDYFETCVRLLKGLDEAELRITNARVKPGGILKIAAHPLAIVSGLSSALSRYQTLAPDVETDVSVTDTPLNLEGSNFDVAIYPPHLITSVNLVRRTLLTSRLILAAAPVYLERVRNVPATPDLSQHTVIFVGDHDRAGTNILLRKDGETTIAEQPRYRYFTTEATAKAMALAGVGIALLPEGAIANYLYSGRLQRILPAYSFVGEETELGIHFVHRQLLPRKTREFIDTCVTFYDNFYARVHKGDSDFVTQVTEGKPAVCLLPRFSQYVPQRLSAHSNHGVPDRGSLVTSCTERVS